MKINKLNYVRVKEFTVAELEKLESIMVEQGFSVIEEVSEYFNSNYFQYGVDMDGNTFFFDYWFTDKGKDITDKFRNYLDNDKGITEDDNNTKTFTKSSLKDGMVVTYRDNSKAMLFGNNFYNFEDKDCPTLNFELDLSVYPNETLSCKLSRMLDIIKVEYDGKILWEDQDHIEKEDRYRQIMEVFNKEGLKGVKSLLESFL